MEAFLAKIDLSSGAIEKPPTRRVQVVSPHGFSALHAYSPSSPGPRSSMASVTWGPGKVVKVVTLALYFGLARKIGVVVVVSSHLARGRMVRCHRATSLRQWSALHI